MVHFAELARRNNYGGMSLETTLTAPMIASGMERPVDLSLYSFILM